MLRSFIFIAFLSIASFISIHSQDISSELKSASQSNSLTEPSSRKPKDERIQWWREARFGMFIHWGVYSVYGNKYDGVNVSGETIHYDQVNSGYPGEWIMFNAQIPRAEYRKAALQFDAKDYDPKEWVRIAKEAGMKYIVITTKHHDGFCLFETKHTDWNAVDASAAKRDLLKDLVKEAKAAGLKIGFYYSQNLDWMHEGGMGNVPEMKGGTYTEEQVEKYINTITIPHILELTSAYDVDLWWFDSRYAVGNKPEFSQKVLDALLKSKVGDRIVVNDRLCLEYNGDYATRETDTPSIPYNGYAGVPTDWEACSSLSNSWGYTDAPDYHWKSGVYVISRLLELASKGGNFLLNVGPDRHGNFPIPAVNTLKEVGEWMNKNSASVYGTVKNELMNPFEYGYVTQKNHTDGSVDFYLHISTGYWDEGEIHLDGVMDIPGEASFLVSGEKVSVEKTKTGLALKLPKEPKDPYYSVIKLHFNGKMKQAMVTALRDNQVRLTPFQATTTETLRKDYVPYAFKNWTRANCEINFNVYLKPGVYTIQAEYSAWNPGEIYFKFENEQFTLPYVKTPSASWTFMDVYSIQEYSEAKITIKSAGTYKINLKRKEESGNFNIIDLRNITLKQDSSTSIDTVSENQSLLCYPVPTDDYLTVEVNKPQWIRIYSAEGRLCQSQYLEDYGYMDVSHLPPGSYIVRGDSDSQQIIIK